jgi:hypothetical protein
MTYGDAWEQETRYRVERWQDMREAREEREQLLLPDARLDEVGWDIYACATRSMSERQAAALALDDTYYERRRVRDDLLQRHGVELRRRYAELRPSATSLDVFDTRAPEQLDFWTGRLPNSTFIYFIQSGEHGPIKIGLSDKPTRRLRQLQTGNPDELLLRHVIPGDLGGEKKLHTRFEPARIRGEWFGKDYLPVIAAFAGGVADRMVQAYDGSGAPPRLIGGDVRSDTELGSLRTEIERMWLAGHEVTEIARYLWLDQEEVEQQLGEMSGTTIYDVRRPGGYDYREGRIVPIRSKPRRRRRRLKPTPEPTQHSEGERE